MPRVTNRTAAEVHRERNMSPRSATRRRPTGIRNGPAKVIRMPTPRVVRRRRAIKAGLGLLALSILAAIIARLYLRHIAAPSPEKLSGLTGKKLNSGPRQTRNARALPASSPPGSPGPASDSLNPPTATLTLRKTSCAERRACSDGFRRTRCAGLRSRRGTRHPDRAQAGNFRYSRVVAAR